jgi:hypothetical protein
MNDRVLPPGLTPRLLSRADAAVYCGMSPNHFEQHVGSMVPPVRIGKRNLWDIKVLDRWLDQQSGLGDALRPVESWLERLGDDRAHPRR